jgi:hypothetical protein
MKEAKIILIIIAITLFVSNYAICDHFYFTDGILDSKGWWRLKSNIYAVIIATVFLSAQIGTKGLLRFVLSVGIGFTISNVIDKLYFNVLEFTQADIYMIIATLVISGYDWYKTSKYYKK